MKKRGLSLIITTLMILLLVFVAIGIVWFVVRNVITEGSEGISLRTFNVDLEINNAFIEENNISVSVKRNPGKGDLAGIKFIFYDEFESEAIEENISLTELDERSFDLTLTVLNTSEVKTVSIAPMYKSDSGENIPGNILDTYTFGVGGVDGDAGEDEGDGGIDPENCAPISDPCGIKICGTATNGTCADIGCGECWAGYTCNEFGGCDLEVSVNNGIVGNVWPPIFGVVMYFDSEDLPKVDVDYIHYYMNFSGSETQCLLIADFITPDFPELYNKTHIRFNFPSDIQTGDAYEIWEFCGCGGLEPC
jgi:hypothetical protein